MSDTTDGKHFQAGETQLDIIVTGFPGKSVCHGSLGFSTIVLLRRSERVALLDVGSFGQRKLIVEHLAKHGLEPADVTDVLLPDFPNIEGTPGIGEGFKILDIIRAYREGFDIDSFSYSDLGTARWRSWAMDRVTFTKN